MATKAAKKPAKSPAKKASRAPKQASRGAPAAAARADATAPATPVTPALAAAGRPTASNAAVPYPQSPVLDMPIAVVVLAVNLFFPGIGTIVAGVVGKQKLVGRGIAQLLLSLVIVGWVWALVTSIQCLTNANRAASNPT